MAPDEMDETFALLSRLPGRGRHTLQLTWQRTGNNAAATFGDGADAAVFLQRLYVSGALHEAFGQPNLGLTISIEDPQSQPGIVPTTVGIPLAFLNAAALGRMLEPEVAPAATAATADEPRRGIAAMQPAA